MHLNKNGTECLSKQIVTQISKSVTNISQEPVVILNWNYGPTDEQITVDIHSILEVSLNQNNKSRDCSRRGDCMKNFREKKVPITRNNDLFYGN
jgi:hypothetical protein